MVLSAAPKVPGPSSFLVLTSQPFLSSLTLPSLGSQLPGLCLWTPLSPSHPDPRLCGPPSTCLSALAKLSSAPAISRHPLPPGALFSSQAELPVPQVPLSGPAASAVTPNLPSLVDPPSRCTRLIFLGAPLAPWELDRLLLLRASWPGCELLCFGALGAEPETTPQCLPSANIRGTTSASQLYPKNIAATLWPLWLIQRRGGPATGGKRTHMPGRVHVALTRTWGRASPGK